MGFFIVKHGEREEKLDKGLFTPLFTSALSTFSKSIHLNSLNIIN